MKIEIIKGQKKDIKIAIPIFKECFLEWKENWEDKIIEQRLKEVFNASKSLFLMLKEDDKKVGFLFGHYSYFVDNKIFIIDEFFIDSKYQHLGYAKRMITNLKKRLKKAKVNMIKLSTERHVKACMFYLNLGFKEDKEEVTMSIDL